MTDPFGLVVVAFFAGMAIIGRGCFLWGRVNGWENCVAWKAIWNPDGTRAEGFDQKVDIVCNACGHLGIFQGEGTGCAYLRDELEVPLPKAEGFDDKVDIVCNACGLVAEISCASCSPVEEERLQHE